MPCIEPRRSWHSSMMVPVNSVGASDSASLDEALELLTTPGARVIAGGQSLLQDLRWRRGSA